MVEDNKIISKPDFQLLDLANLEIVVTGFDKRIVNYTSYSVEIQITLNNRKICYRKLTRYRELECFDNVLKDKFKNLTLPELPKASIFDLRNKENDRLTYLKNLLVTMLDYAKREKDLRQKLLGYLYNLLLLTEVERIPSLSNVEQTADKCPFEDTPICSKQDLNKPFQ